MNKKLSPVMRLSLGLVSLTIFLILSAKMFGLVPDEKQAVLDARLKFCESLALQLSWSAVRNDRRSIQQTLTTLVERDPDVLSASLKSIRSGTLAEIGNHAALWQPSEDGSMKQNNINVPIFTNDGHWGTLEIVFEELKPISRLSSWTNSSFGLLVFVGVIGFILFTVFLKRALSELDPSRVIPAHVKAAFDALAEGVLIIDEYEQIVLANSAFKNMIGLGRSDLTGMLVSKFHWYWPATMSETLNPAERGLPWQKVLQGKGMQSGVPMSLKGNEEGFFTLMVNASPILDGEGKPRGALATFDDVSELQKNNAQLLKTMASLTESKDEIKRQNKELTFLATRDPMTNCFNRRAMMDKFTALFEEARLERTSLCCAMMDIDHFKLFNDRYGHAAGDKVIKFVATTLNTTSRTSDVVARYGGEEFCIAMPGISEAEAAKKADSIRKAITINFPEVFTCSSELTVSIGIASIKDHRDELERLIIRADDALYHAKNSGRNQVATWSAEMIGSSVSGQAATEGDQDTGKSMLVQVLQDPDETARIANLAEKILERDALVEANSGAEHRQHGYDELTELPKRILFYDRVISALGVAQHDGLSVAILYVELDFDQRDGEKMHPVMNDSLIKAAAERLSDAMSRMKDRHSLFGKHDEHTLARLGNAEFGVILPEMDDPEAPTWIAKDLIKSISLPHTHEGKECFINCSIGISLYPLDAEDAESLVGRASQARHLAAASKGRHNYMFYSADMNIRSYQQVKLEDELRHALSKNELEVYYQPVYDLKENKLASVEALLRWNTAEMGQVGPDLFIYIAEQTGLILEIGAWVVRQACVQAKKWHAEGATDLRVAVNLSPVQLREEGLHKMIMDVLDETGLDPSYLELEVTENAMLDDLVQAKQIIQTLRSSGVSIAMDDFGTGFSSLSHLKKSTVDKLKIDRSFIMDVVTDERDAAVVSSIIIMAKRLSMTVVAEGVEDQQQLEFLKEHDCDYVQGFLMSKAVTHGKISELISQDASAEQQFTGPVEATSNELTEA
jgi:diguanylate cyclase (GGDEF)-like protein/PAS domain S-box-containing protein